MSETRISVLLVDDHSLVRRGFRGGDIMKAVRQRPELKPIAGEHEPIDDEGTEGENVGLDQ